MTVHRLRGHAAAAAATWYWYSPASSNRDSGKEPVAPSAVFQVTVISTSGSSVAVVATWVCRKVWPSAGPPVGLQELQGVGGGQRSGGAALSRDPASPRTRSG